MQCVDQSLSCVQQGARIMTIEQIEGNEPMHENWGTALGEEIDEVRSLLSLLRH